ncbi:SCO6745 family protein [Kribbella sp. CA-294648]|uniref:SCO6745 family protein n=1 Tax=Kribbella sp. CA-294648 TaxID=3239948 RepID=UPI003D92F5DD
MTESRARRLWKVLEPYHAITYFAPDTRKATDALGLRGGWMSYFACRAAPLGPVGPGLVTAVFYNFHPSMVARAIPDAWSFATPAQLLTARLEAVDSAVRRFPPTSTPVRRAAELARQAAELAPTAGRPLGAANAALDWPDEPHLVLWQASTILRESRGDGHVAALVGAQLSPCQACVTISAAGGPSKEVFQLNRRWSDEEWAAAEEDLRVRGLLDADGVLTEAGRALRQQVEDTTDRLAEQGWSAFGDSNAEELDRLVRPISGAIMANGLVPADNPMAMRWEPADLPTPTASADPGK